MLMMKAAKEGAALKINFSLSSTPGLEHSKPPQAHLSGATQLIALTPGKWSAKVQRWNEGKLDRFSAIRSWKDTKRWVCYFYYSPFDLEHPLELKGVGSSAKKGSPEEAFLNFPQDATVVIGPSKRGPDFPAPVLFFVPTDFYHEDGEIRIELEWLGNS